MGQAENMACRFEQRNEYAHHEDFGGLTDVEEDAAVVVRQSGMQSRHAVFC